MSYTPLSTSSLDALHGLSLHSLESLPGSQELACLSPAELDRAARFLRERDRRRYLAARCALRQRLAQQLGVSAAALRFVEGPEGKPFLADEPRCQFNMSHSEELALVGLGKGGEIGVDIEMLRAVDDAEPLARLHYTAAEFDAMMVLGERSRPAAFLRLWTRKEACLKALGTGLSVAPSSFEVGLESDFAELTIERPSGPVRLALRSIDAGASAVAAVAWLTWGYPLSPQPSRGCSDIRQLVKSRN